VNKQRVMSCRLSSGDLIHFGPQVRATFLILEKEKDPVLALDNVEELIRVDTGAETAHQMIPTVDWHLADYFPEDLLELIELGHFDNPLSAQALKTAIFEQCRVGYGEIEPEWQPVLERLAELFR